MSDEHAAHRLPRWLWGLLILAGLGLAIWGLRGVLTPIFFAFLIAYFLDPLVDRFEERGIPRAAGIVLVLFFTLGAMGLFAVLLVPSIIREITAFADSLPDKLEGLRVEWEPWLVAHGVPVPHDLDEVWELVSQTFAPAETAAEGEGETAGAASGLAEQAAPVLQTVATWIWGRTTTALGAITSALIVPVFAFYLLYDFDRMTAGIRDLIPHQYRPFVVDVAGEVDDVLGQFVRGQITVMVILAVLYSVAYSIARVPLAIPIGIIAGLLSFIPYVGGASALILALLMCLLDPQGWWQVAGVVVGYGVIQGLEGFVITPRIVGDKVGLDAIWVLLALMVGGELFGFLGVLLAVPAAAVVKIFVVRAVAYYRKSDLYLRGRAEHEGPLVRLIEEEGLPDDPEVAKAKAHAEEEEAEGDAQPVASEPAPAAASEPAPAGDPEPDPEPGPDPDPDSAPAPAEPEGEGPAPAPEPTASPEEE